MPRRPRMIGYAADRTGPNLTEIARAPIRWIDVLADPAKLRPHTTMPNLADDDRVVPKRYAIMKYLISPLARLATVSAAVQRPATKQSIERGRVPTRWPVPRVIKKRSLLKNEEDDREPLKPEDYFFRRHVRTRGISSLLGGKTRPGGLAAYLQNPLKTTSVAGCRTWPSIREATDTRYSVVLPTRTRPELPRRRSSTARTRPGRIPVFRPQGRDELVAFQQPPGREAGPISARNSWFSWAASIASEEGGKPTYRPTCSCSRRSGAAGVRVHRREAGAENVPAYNRREANAPRSPQDRSRRFRTRLRLTTPASDSDVSTASTATPATARAAFRPTWRTRCGSLKRPRTPTTFGRRT